MSETILIKNLSLVRFISKVLPLKRKLNFLIKNYLRENLDVAIPYYKAWDICITVTDLNRSTVEKLILEGINSQPEIALIKLLRKKLPGNMVFVDVGGNIGTFLCQFLDKCERVIVFEPMPALAHVIRRSIEFNKDHKIFLIDKAAGDKDGKVLMQDNNNSRVTTTEYPGDIVEIEITTLDKELALLQKVDFIKIDVEGYEIHVLNGAKELIKKFRPVLLIEVHPMYLEHYNEPVSDIMTFLEENNYDIKYFSFMEEIRMSRVKRLLSRWKGNKGVQFSKEDFLKDIPKQPRLASYHFYCEPK